VQVPGINAWGENYLVLEWLNSTRSTFAQWQDFARQLAELHNKPYGRFGFEDNGYCGESVQINDWCDSGFEFFVTRRIQPQARWARDRGLLSAADSDALDSFCTRVEQLVPEMPAVLLHGDLWSGNVMFTERSPCVIDPAAYFGWAESDVAMTCLFGGFPDSFYLCYFEACSLPGGFYDRVDVYNLYHLLNHLNLFGGSYYQQVASTLKKYG
jgi:fructosamine-3-kinase